MNLSDVVKASWNIQERHNLDYIQQDRLLKSIQLEQVLTAEHYMRRDQVLLLLIQEGIVERKQK